MKPALALVLATAVVGLASCDQPKPRPPPPPGGPPAAAAVVAAPQPPVTQTAAASAGLVKRPDFPGFSLDLINEAPDPLNQPATIASGGPVRMSGFGFDPVTRKPGKGVDIVLDGVAYPTAYGSGRPDVAAYFKDPDLAATGYVTVLPAEVVKAGAHTAVVRVISTDGAGYTESPPIRFTAR